MLYSERARVQPMLHSEDCTLNTEHSPEAEGRNKIKYFSGVL